MCKQDYYYYLLPSLWDVGRYELSSFKGTLHWTQEDSECVKTVSNNNYYTTNNKDNGVKL